MKIVRTRVEERNSRAESKEKELLYQFSQTRPLHQASWGFRENAAVTLHTASLTILASESGV